MVTAKILIAKCSEENKVNKDLIVDSEEINPVTDLDDDFVSVNDEPGKKLDLKQG